MEFIPNEILGHILNYINNPKDYCTFNATCRKFRSIIKDKESKIIESDSPQKDLEKASIESNLPLLKSAIHRGAPDWNDWNGGMRSAALGGHQQLVYFFIGKGANAWNGGMTGVAAGCGYENLINFFIEKGANNWNWGMGAAARGGHRHLVDFFIAKGAKNWNQGMYGAARNGNKDLVDFYRKWCQ